MQHRFADNLTHFARVLRRAGLSVGTDRVLLAIEVIELVGLDRRCDVHAALSAVMLDSHEQQAVFDAVFAAFWRDPKLLERMMHMALPTITGRGGQREKALERPRRVEEALAARRERAPDAAPPEDEIRLDAQLAFSDREKLQQADFESMSTEEFLAAQRIARTIELPLKPIRTRRHVPAARGRIDLRRTMRRMTRMPDTLVALRTAARRRRPPLVILLDISGSMERYSRMFLQFAHGLTRRDPRVQTLSFGTRLTHLSHSLRNRDADLAMMSVASRIQDWQGGTRIGTSLGEFNRLWARRVLSGNAAMLLVTDGLDRDDGGELGHQAALLSRFARELVWLNPLLRFDGFEPRAAGVRALLPHVDRFLPMHNLDSLQRLGSALSQSPGTGNTMRPKTNHGYRR